MRGANARGAAARAAARRVRALLERFEHPTSSFERIVLDAELRIGALQPRFALLETTPFEGLPRFDPPTSQTEDAAQSRRSSRVVELPERGRRDRPGEGATAVAQGRTRADANRDRPVAAAAGATSAVVLPITTRRERTASMREDARRRTARGGVDRGGNASRDRRPGVSVTPDGARGVDAVAEIDRVARAHVATALPAVSLGGVAQRALAAIAGARNRSSRSDVSASGAASTTGGPVESLQPAPPFRPTLRPSPPRSSAGDRAKAAGPSAAGGWAAPGASMQTEVSGSPARHVNPVAPAAARSHAPAVFHFDPLEQRRPAHDSDDELAERIGEVLREQARRQGVDLT